MSKVGFVMQHNAYRLAVCGILLFMAACAPQPSLTSATTNTPLIPTATSIPPTLTPTAIPPELISEIDTTLADLSQVDIFTGSVLIGRQGTVLLSQGYGLADRMQVIPNTPQTRFRLGSVTKQFTAMAILILESQGKLSVQDPICNYFTECPAAWKTITIHHLLTHTSGIPNFTSLEGYLGTRATPSAPEQTIARFKDLPLDFQPGEIWNYSNSGYVALGYIIEQVSSQSYEDFLQQSIFTPLNLHDTGYDHNSDTLAIGYQDMYSVLPADYIDMSIPYAAGGLYSTVEDLYRWEQSLSTEQLVPRIFLDKMFAPYATMPDSGGWAYGYGWLIGTERGRPVTKHGGGIDGFTTLVTRYPNEQIVIIVLSNQQNFDPGLIHDILSKKIFGDK